MRVIATNESGYSQYAFDYYYTDIGKIYGTKCFYVDNAGQSFGIYSRIKICAVL